MNSFVYTQPPLTAPAVNTGYAAGYDRRNLRRDLNVIFAALIIHVCSYLFSFFVNGAYAGILTSVFPSQEAHYAVTYAAESLSYLTEFMVPVVLIMVFAHISPFRLTSAPEGGRTVSGKPRLNLFFSVCVGLCAVEAAGLIAGWVLDLFGSMGFDFYIGVENDLPTDTAGIIMYVVSVAVVPGFIEELLFRGCVMGVLKRYNAVYAVTLSAMLFAAMHCAVQQFFYAFCAGLVFGWIAYRTGRLWPGMLIHMLNNALSVLYEYLYAYAEFNLYLAVYLSVSMTVMVLGIIGVAVLIHKGGRLKESENEVGLMTCAKMTARVLPVLYVLIVAAITMMVLSV